MKSKYLTDILSEEEYSNLSLIYLKNNQQKEIDFWNEFWQKEENILKEPMDIQKYCGFFMSFSAFITLLNNAQDSEAIRFVTESDNPPTKISYIKPMEMTAGRIVINYEIGVDLYVNNKTEFHIYHL